MSNCGACDLGIPHEHNGYHPAVFLYGSSTAPDAARHWYEQAIDVAKDYNRVNEEIEWLRKHWIVRMIERRKK